MSKVLDFISLGDRSSSGVSVVDDVQLIDLDETIQDPSESEENQALEQYVRTGKLSKDGAIAAKVDGAESLEPGATQYNAKKASMGFLSSIAKGFVEFIKKIIEYIKAGVDWVIKKITQLVNFVGRGRELDKHNELLADINKVLDDLGINYAGGPDFIAMCKDTPYLTKQIDLFQCIKPKMMDYKEFAVQLHEAIPEYGGLIREVNRQTAAVESVKRKVENGIKHIRNRVKDNSLSVADVDDYFGSITGEVYDKLNQTQLNRIIVKLSKHLQGEKFVEMADDLKIDLSKVNEELKKNLASSSEKLTPDQLKARAEHLMGLKTSIRETRNFGHFHDDVQYIKFILSQDDAKFLEKVASEFGDNRIITAYQIAASAIAKFTTAMKSAMDLITLVRHELDNISRWIVKVEFITAVYATHNLMEREEELKRAQTVKVLTEGKDIKGMDKVRKDYLDGEDHFIRDRLTKGLPDLKKKIEQLGRLLNIRVK